MKEDFKMLNGLKKFVSVVMVLALSTAISVSAFADDSKTSSTGYDASLQKVGITEKDFAQMPDSKKQEWKNVKLKDVNTTTKYYRCTESSPNSRNTKLLKADKNYVEITAQQFYEESQLYLTSLLTKSAIKASSDTNGSSTSWVTFTTKLANALDNDWVLTNDVTFIAAPAVISTHVTGLGCNQNCSVVKDSEYLRRNYDLYEPTTGVYDEGLEDYIWSANAGKSSNGYAFSKDIVYTEIHNRIFAALRIMPNVSNVTVVDGYGQYAKYSSSVTPSVSFSTSGASISLSPSSNVSKAPNTHVQLRVK